MPGGEKKKTEGQYKRAIVRKTKTVGTYRAEVVETINRLAKLYVQADKLTEQFEESGGMVVVEHTNKAGATNLVKNPIFAARMDVYNQLLEYERELGLTPAAMKKMAIKGQEKENDPFSAAIARMEAGE